MKNKQTVCAVVVTYNRKDLLINCLDSIVQQAKKPDAICVIDNCSNDGTAEQLLKHGYLDVLPPEISNEPCEQYRKNNSFIDGDLKIIKIPNSITIYYVRMNKNTGGAGGFFEGVKRSYERGYDWLWLMDDDGMPSSKCLDTLLNKSSIADFLNPLVLDIEDKDKLSFGIFDKNSNSTIKTYKESLQASIEGIVRDTANPFNGTFISKELIRKIGYPKKELFIWGDEEEYLFRAIKSGLNVCTVTKAIYYHPKGRLEQASLLWNKYRVNYQTNILKNYCYIRNNVFIQKSYNKKSLLKSFLLYSIYFLVNFKLKEYKFYLSAVYDGLFNVWGKEREYLD